MSLTSIPYGSEQAVKVLSAGLFAASMQRPTVINRLAGSLSSQSEAEKGIRKTSTNKKPVVRCQDLQRAPGDEITFDLINPLQALPSMGGSWLEGRGSAMTFSQDKVRVNQARFAVSAGDAIAQQRTPHQLRPLAMTQAKSLMDRFQDQAALVHLAGARGFHNNVEWVVPLASHPDFANIMVNTVRAPTRNRHFISTGSGIEQVAASGGSISIATTDVFNADVVDGLATWLEGTPLPPPGIEFENDQAASDDPLYVLLVSPEQYNSFVQGVNFRTYQANAMARAQQAKNHPIFTSDSLLWRNILIVRVRKPIRFYASNPLNWCASATSTTETTSDVVPAGFGTTYAVDRALLLGGQALAEAWGKHAKSDGSFFISEKLLDHDDKPETAVGEIGGRSKIRFNINFGSEVQPTDYGVVAIDTAVRLAGV